MDLKLKLAEQAIEGFQTALREVVEGAAADLQAYAAEMANDAIDIALLPAQEREPLMQELGDQAQLIAEKHRLRAVDAGWDVVRKVTNTAIQVSVRMAAAALIGAI